MSGKAVVVSDDAYCFLVDREVALKLPKYKESLTTSFYTFIPFVVRGINHRKLRKWLDYCKSLVSSPSTSQVLEQSFVNQADPIGLFSIIREDTVLNIIKDIYRNLPYYSSCKLIATHALAYLSYGKYVAIEEAVLERLVEFISQASFTYAGNTMVVSAVEVVGNIVRWGKPDQIKYLKNDCKLLQCLGSGLPCFKVKKFRVGACQIISNIAAQSDTMIKDLDEAGLREPLCRLLGANDCDVKLEAAWAIYNCVYGYKFKRLTAFMDGWMSDY